MRARLRVALDATPLIGRRTGVGEFCAGALSALVRADELEVSAFALTAHARRLATVLPPGVVPAARSVPARLARLLWAHTDLIDFEVLGGRVDVVHGTNYVVPPARRAGRVVSVFDLSALHHPELCDRRSLGLPRLVRRAVETGAFVHTAARAVATEIREAFGVADDRLRIVAPGVPSVPGSGDRPGPVVAGRYVLALGTIEPRKDLVGLVLAFERLARRDREVRLVIAGADGWGVAPVRAAIAASPVASRILRLGYVSAATRDALLANATVYAFPSRYEGFGFPPLEAMAWGVPVVASAVGALPEVLGDAACLVPPRDPDALAAALAEVLDDPARAAALVEGGLARVAAYSWTSCANALAALYRDAAAAR